jgi:hypothetical protein
VSTAFPVNQQNDFSSRIVHVHYDFLDKRTNDTLA